MEVDFSKGATPWEVTIRLLVAVLVGGVIGWDRQRSDKPAGLRTHMLVALGFLGAGVIIQDRGHVSGITTAASVWVSGALGSAAGVGAFVLAGIATLFTLLILVVARLEGLHRASHPRPAPADERHAPNGPAPANSRTPANAP
jgi:putative Mg2+ transporter-C (MgtC) family protein